ncbi:Mu transposase C-terminal domain-containing protein [Kordiimonas lipolytica]|uniref:Mu transposase C-terminal domain-containing protein n=1 Tax=Kordiimonas lipolytica TaxID=1662421 RepID=A0ABV8U9Z2_9PROT|nr:Mu transposase C-terminal domain-containing protein [Kordiimonas lipolytica]
MTNSQDKIHIMQERVRIIRPLAMDPNRSVADIAVAAALLGKSERTIRRWIQDFQTAPVADSLKPGHRASPGRKPKFPSETLDIISRVIKWRLRKKEKIPAKRPYRLVKWLCLRRNLRYPSLRYMQRKIGEVSEIAKARAKMISKEPRDLRLYPNHHEVAWPLDQIQIDHTRMDLIVDLTLFGMGKKRVWLTLAIDVASRMVFGYYIGLKAPSARSAGLAMLRGVLPKGPLIEAMGIDLEEFRALGILDPWPICNVPIWVGCDHGADFKSYAFRAGCLLLGAQVEFRKIVNYGGHIERLLGTFMQELHGLSGTTFSNTREVQGYDAVKNCVYTLEDVELWVVTTILIYHVTPHSKLGEMTPLQKFLDLQARRPVATRLVPDKVHVQSAFLPSVKRAVTKQGVRFQNRQYSNPQLAPLIGQHIQIKYNPGNLDIVHACLDGITPSFDLHLIGRAGKSRHMDAPIDNMPTLAVKEEAKRQKDIADGLAVQRDLLFDRIRSHRKNGAATPSLPPAQSVPNLPVSAGRPLPFEPREGR